MYLCVYIYTSISTQRFPGSYRYLSDKAVSCFIQNMNLCLCVLSFCCTIKSILFIYLIIKITELFKHALV